MILQLQHQMAAVEAKQAKLEQAKARPAPVLDSSDRQKDEEIRKLQEEKAAMQTQHDKVALLSKLEKDKERSKRLHEKEEMQKQFDLFQQALADKDAENQALKSSTTSDPKPKQKETRSASQPPKVSSNQSFASWDPINEEPKEDEQEFDEDDQEEEWEEEDYEYEEETWSGWTWDDERWDYVRDETSPLYSELSDSEKYMYAKQHEPDYIRFEDIPTPASGKFSCG